MTKYATRHKAKNLPPAKDKKAYNHAYYLKVICPKKRRRRR